MKTLLLNRFRYFIVSFILLSMTFSLFSCGTILNGISEEVFFSSEPVEAELYVDGNFIAKTPLTMSLEKTKPYHIEFRMENKESKVYSLNRHIGTGWLILDLITGVVPMMVDATTGAWYSFDETDILVLMNEDSKTDDILQWKKNLYKLIGKRNFYYEWKTFVEQNDIQITLKEWIFKLSEDEYNYYKMSGKSLEIWLYDELLKN